MASPPPWSPGLRCSCGEKVLAVVGLTPSELHAIVADDIQEPACAQCGSGSAAQRCSATAATAAEPPPPPPLPPRLLPPICCTSTQLGDLQQKAALMALQQAPSRLGTDISLEPATPLVSERLFVATATMTQPSQSGRPGSAGSAGSGTLGGTQQQQQGSPRCSQSDSSAFRFESVNRVAAVAGKEYSHRRSGERHRRSREKELRWSAERPSAGGGTAAPAAPASPRQQCHSRLQGGSTDQRGSQPAWQPPPPGRLGGGTAAQRLADVPLLPPDPQPAEDHEYDSCGVAAWLAESAAAAGGGPVLIGPDAVLQPKVPAASRGHGLIAGSARPEPAAPQPQPLRPSSSLAGPAMQLPSSPKAAPQPKPVAVQVPVTPSVGSSGQVKASPGAANPAFPPMHGAPTSLPAALSSPSAHAAAALQGGSSNCAAAEQPSGKVAAKASCRSSSAEGKPGCALLNALAMLGRLLRF